MSKILYGLCGVGIGHAIRGRVIIEELSRNNEVMIICSSKPYEYLKKYFDNVHKIEGFELVFRNNSIVDYLTLFKNLKKIHKLNFENTYELLDKFNPDLVISDWETFSSFYAKKRKIPLISIDNQHFLSSGDLDFHKRYYWDYLKAKIMINILTKKADYDIITSFYETKLKKAYKNVFLVPPVLREEILKAKTKKEDYVLVYQSTNTYEDLIEILKDVDEKFIIYGFDKENKEKNLEFKKFNEKEFLKDLINCKAVICNGGFTLISEAMHLKKPLLTVPIKKHFEQLINCLYVNKKGYGECYFDLNKEKVLKFINNLDKYKKLDKKQKDNKAVYKLLNDITKKGEI